MSQECARPVCRVIFRFIARRVLRWRCCCSPFQPNKSDVISGHFTSLSNKNTPSSPAAIRIHFTSGSHYPDHNKFEHTAHKTLYPNHALKKHKGRQPLSGSSTKTINSAISHHPDHVKIHIALDHRVLDHVCTKNTHTILDSCYLDYTVNAAILLMH